MHMLNRCPFCHCTIPDAFENHHIVKCMDETILKICSNCHSIISKRGGKTKESHEIYKKYLTNSIKHLIQVKEKYPFRFDIFGEEVSAQVKLREKIEELKKELESFQVET